MSILVLIDLTCDHEYPPNDAGMVTVCDGRYRDQREITTDRRDERTSPTWVAFLARRDGWYVGADRRIAYCPTHRKAHGR